MDQNRIIGRVLSVDNFRVFIKVEDDLRGTYKSGVLDIYEIARINSYLVIPVGADRVVAMITRVTMKEELEFDKTSTAITLPTSARYISATMLGTISKKDKEERYIQGVYNFPTLDNPVWYVTEKDLRHIFDDKSSEEKIDLAKDFYLPIGSSPAFSDFKVKICPDQLFVKHAAILGNTGSGKSSTLTSILRNLFRFSFNESKLENAHIVIFDTNGEYKEAFLPDEKRNIKPEDLTELENINAYYYGGEGNVQVPYWLMNWHDFKNLLRPSDGTQAPVLNRALGLAKNNVEHNTDGDSSDITLIELQHLEAIAANAKSGDWWKSESMKSSYDEFKHKLPNSIQNFNFGKYSTCPTAQEIQCIDDFIKERRVINTSKQLRSEQNIDMPTWFSYQELCKQFIDVAIDQESSSNNRIAEFVSTLRLRMNSFLNDKRMAIPLMLKDTNEFNKKILPEFLSFLLGDFNSVFAEKSEDSFIKQYNDKQTVHSKQKTHQVTIVDVSQLPFEVLETVTALLGRIILEFVAHFSPSDRGKFPIVIVLEEAQNYISENSDSVAKVVFEKIAREGRKYGVSLIVCSQRPSELSKTVLSQCNSYIIHRLQNPDDQRYIKGLVSSASSDILDQLPIIPQQHAIITGDCVRAPIQVRIDNVSPTPNSNNPRYVGRWLEEYKIPYEETTKRWLGLDEE